MRIVPALARLLCAACLAIPLLPATASAAREESARIGGVDVVVWMPSTQAADRLAVIMFSHALYMCPTQSRYLTRAIADAGYLVIAPLHADSSCRFSLWPSVWRISGKPSPLWNDSDYRDRADDIRNVVAALPADARYGRIADVTRLGLVGHSLGGYTVLGLGGAWPSWRLRGVRAIVALTPYSLPFDQSEGLRRLSAPTMYQAGQYDPVFTLPLEYSGYARTPQPKYLVEMASASHMAWTDLGVSSRETIVDYTVAFLDHYVRGEPETPTLQAALPGVSSFLRN